MLGDLKRGPLRGIGSVGGLGPMTDHEKELGTDEEEFSYHIRWRAWSMVVLVSAWMLWLPFWWFRWGAELEEAQRMAVVMLSILLFLTVLLVIWVPWSMRHGMVEERRMWENPAFRSRFWVSTLVCLGSLAVVTCWMWEYADDIMLGSVMLLVILLVYAWSVVGPAQRSYEEAEKEE